MPRCATSDWLHSTGNDDDAAAAAISGLRQSRCRLAAFLRTMPSIRALHAGSFRSGLPLLSPSLPAPLPFPWCPSSLPIPRSLPLPVRPTTPPTVALALRPESCSATSRLRTRPCSTPSPPRTPARVRLKSRARRAGAVAASSTVRLDVPPADRLTQSAPSKNHSALLPPPPPTPPPPPPPLPPPRFAATGLPARFALRFGNWPRAAPPLDATAAAVPIVKPMSRSDDITC
mmetsp:Transcript_39767/g.116065  ORF Transcript_39767/g.116065 Transcript_39767/m.116065 type:complete len:231 (+) Transcript_39767:1326-2018(+)